MERQHRAALHGRGHDGPEFEAQGLDHQASELVSTPTRSPPATMPAFVNGREVSRLNVSDMPALARAKSSSLRTGLPRREPIGVSFCRSCQVSSVFASSG